MYDPSVLTKYYRLRAQEFRARAEAEDSVGKPIYLRLAGVYDELVVSAEQVVTMLQPEPEQPPAPPEIPPAPPEVTPEPQQAALPAEAPQPSRKTKRRVVSPPRPKEPPMALMSATAAEEIPIRG